MHSVLCSICFVFPVKVKYNGTKSYNDSFKDDGFKDAVKSTTYSIKNLVPGSQYDFEVYVNMEGYETSVCNKSSVASVKGETRLEGEYLVMTLIYMLR